VSSAPIPLDDQIQEVERELKLRRKHYPRWVCSRPPKMTEKTAEQQINRMEAVRDSLLELKRIKGEQQ
jgi:hypothetical protein